jgi:formylglycine-generating enzyme required for sulfatase activity
MEKYLLIFSVLTVGLCNAANFTNILVRQQWPWNGKVHIDYQLVDTDGLQFDISLCVTNGGKAVEIPLGSLSGDLYSVRSGERQIIWDPSAAEMSEADWKGDCSFCLTAKPAIRYNYLVIDISEGSKDGAVYPSYLLENEPEGGWGDEFRTTKMVFRRCEPGTFVMGSPEDEPYREGSGASSEKQSEVTFTNCFYVGVFELTVKQHELIAGSNVTYVAETGEVVVDNTNPLLPATGLRYRDLRGNENGVKWPSNINVDEGSFMAKLRSRVILPNSIPPGWVFDLPTEAQWEYACRAGTAQSRYDGSSPTPVSSDTSATDPALNPLGWYRANSDYARHKVGTRAPNNWGLYDMYGNASEYVIEGTDGSGTMPSGIEPKNVSMGRNGGLARRVRGGSHCASFMHCRSASRRELWNMDESVNILRYSLGNGFAMGARICLHYVE